MVKNYLSLAFSVLVGLFVAMPLNAYNPVSIFPDGKNILAVAEGGVLNQWDVTSCRLVRRYNIATISGDVKDIAISPSGAHFISVNNQTVSDKSPLGWSLVHSFKLWDMHTGEPLRTFINHPSYVNSVEFSPDGRNILSTSEQMHLWDAESGKLLRVFGGNIRPYDAVFSPDGWHILSGNNDNTVRVWDSKTGKLQRTLKGHTDNVNAVAFSPAGNNFVSGSSDKTLILWETTTGRPISIMRGHSEAVNSVTFSPDGTLVLSGSWDGTAKVWDVKSGKSIRTFKGLSGVISAAFLSSGKHVVLNAGDSSIGGSDLKIFNIASGESLTLMAKQDEWTCYTADGYFDASRHGGELVSLVRGMDLFAIDQFAIHYNRPDIILSRIEIGSPELIKHFNSRYRKRLLKTHFSEDMFISNLRAPQISDLKTEKNGKMLYLDFRLFDTKYRLKTFNIYINDVPLFGAYGKEINGKNIRKREIVELVTGTNKIEISLINEVGAESHRAITYAEYDQEVIGDLYYIGFGVSNYKDKKLNLKFAHKDIQDLASLFLKMKGKFRRIHTNIFTDDKVTIENIKKAKALLKNAKVDDTLVLFVAGHGVHENDSEASYYFLVHDVDLNNLSGTAANFDLIENIMHGIAPRNKLFLMDTCESGEIDNETQNQYYAMAKSRNLIPRTNRGIEIMRKNASKFNRVYLYQKDRYIYNDLLRRSGAIVFSSSRGSEFSYESEKIKNGFFTEEIIKALTSNKADKNRDGIVSTDELRDYVSKEVSKHTDDMQHPTVDRDNIFQKFGFPIVQ